MFTVIIGLGGPLYYAYNKEPPNSIGNCLGPYINFLITGTFNQIKAHEGSSYIQSDSLFWSLRSLEESQTSLQKIWKETTQGMLVSLEIQKPV